MEHTDRFTPLVPCTPLLAALLAASAALAQDAAAENPDVDQARAQLIEELKTQQSVADLQQQIATAHKARQEAELAAAKAAQELKTLAFPQSDFQPPTGKMTVTDKNGFYATLLAYKSLKDKGMPKVRDALVEFHKHVVDLEAGVIQGLLISNRLDLAADSMKAHYVRESIARLTSLLKDQGGRNESFLKQHGLIVSKANDYDGDGAKGLATIATVTLGTLGAAAEIASFFKSDYAITGQTADLSDIALQAELARLISDTNDGFKITNSTCAFEKPGRERAPCIFIEGMLRIDDAKPAEDFYNLSQTANSLRAEKALLDMLAADLAVRAKQTKDEEARNALNAQQVAAKALAAKTDALLTSFTDFAQTVNTASGTGGLSPLGVAALMDKLDKHKVTHLLSVQVIQGGGQVATKQTAWNNKAGFVGGAVFTFMLFELDNGRLVWSGTEMVQEEALWEFPKEATGEDNH